MKYTRIFLGALAVIALAGCKQDDALFENKIFIDADNFKNEVRVAVDENIQTLSRSLSVAIAQPEEEDLTVSFVESPELLDKYREAFYDKDAELLTPDHYDLASLKTSIKAGEVKSAPATLQFIKLGKEDLDYSKTYVLPLTLNCDQLSVLESARTMYFVVKEASLVNVVADINTNCAWPDFDGFSEVGDLEECTMEAMVNGHSFNNKSHIHTIMGIEDHLLIRVGDVTIPGNQLQIAAGHFDEEGNTSYRKDISNAKMRLRTDRWYHIATTFNKGYVKVYIDGELVAEQNLDPIKEETKPDGTVVKVHFTKLHLDVKHSDESGGQPRCFWIGYSYDGDRSFDGMISEVRIWNKVLTEEEINAPNHFYKIYNPEENEHLLAYWKFAEGFGSHVKDYSKYGHDLTGDHDFVWYPVALPK